ncbi:MAG: TlpA family protein disulfide reductase [Gammaproteobacteria bacterium]|nr:TlpA family protein disulfide reductase [Gammaproteobacteria bacterium]
MSTLSVYILSVMLLLAGMQAQAVDYRLPDLDGQMQSLEQYRGKWLIVNYWATWCTTCLKELPDLVSLHNANRDKDIVVVGINFESISPDVLRDFVNEQEISYPMLLTQPVPATPLGRVFALPTTYIIDPDGKLVAGQVGLVRRQDLEAYISQKRLTEDYAVITAP